MPYHVRITKKSRRSHDALELDLSRKALEEHIVTPFNQGARFTCGGEIIDSDDVECIQITYTEEKSEDLIPIIQEERRQKHWATPTISDKWYVADRGKDVTRKFITNAPIVIAKTNSPKSEQHTQPPGGNIIIKQMVNSQIQHSSPGANQRVGESTVSSEKDEKTKGYAAGVVSCVISAVLFYMAFPFDHGDGLLIIFGLAFAILGIMSLIWPLTTGQVADRILQSVSHVSK